MLKDHNGHISHLNDMDNVDHRYENERYSFNYHSFKMLSHLGWSSYPYKAFLGSIKLMKVS